MAEEEGVPGDEAIQELHQDDGVDRRNMPRNVVNAVYRMCGSLANHFLLMGRRFEGSKPTKYRDKRDVLCMNMEDKCGVATLACRLGQSKNTQVGMNI